MKNNSTLRYLLIVAAFLCLALPRAVQAQQPCQSLFTYSLGNPSPNGTLVSFYDSTWTLGTVTSWQWSFGDGTGSNLQNPNHTYAPGTYIACLTTISMYQNQACTSIWCDTITVAGGTTCSAAFTSYPDSSGFSIYFNNNSTSSGSNPYYYWSFGDGGTSNQTNPTHTYNTTGWYWVCLTVVDSSIGCSDTHCDSIFAGATVQLCNALFTVSTNNNVASFTNQSTGSFTSVLWTFGDNTTSTALNPIHTYTASGTYQVCLTVWSNTTGCQDTYCQTITVTGGGTNCQAAYSYTTNPSSGVTQFTSTSTGSPTSWFWSFGDGTSGTGPNPTHSYSSSGVYIVCLTISGVNCQSTWCDSIYVSNAITCSAQFGWNSNGGNSVVFNNQSISSGTNPFYYWTFGDGTTAWGANPSHTYTASGTYQVCLMLIDSTISCWDTYCYNVTVQGGSGCSSNFAIYPDSLIAHTYWAYNLATGTGGLTYLWSWGDSTYSTSAYPSHTYAGPGLYTICLTITDATGCSSTTCYQWQLLRLAGSAPVTINVVAGTTGITEVNGVHNINVFPNPAASHVTVSWSNESSESVRIQLYDLGGRLVTDFGTASDREVNRSLDLKGIPAGLYFVKFSNSQTEVYRKLMVE